VTTSNLRPWPKGVSGNPGGAVALSPELKAIRSLSQAEVTKIVSKVARMNVSELERAAADQTAPAIEVAIATIFDQSIKKADHARLTFLLDRAIGKVPLVEIGDADSDVPLARLSVEELLQLVKPKPKELGAG